MVTREGTAAVTGASLATHPFLRGMRSDHLVLLGQATTLTAIPARHRLFEQGSYARGFWLIRAGQVAVDLQVPGYGRVIVETLGRGDVLGWSWLFPPHECQFGAVAIQPVEAFELNGEAVRACCGEHPELGLELTRRFSQVLAARLRATRLRLADQCAHPQCGPPGG